MSKAAKGTTRLDAAPTFLTNMLKLTSRYLREDREEIGDVAEGPDAQKEEKLVSLGTLPLVRDLSALCL